jgi:hypothetical protein
MRSLRSEYDYGSKKNFVDVLGNVKKNPLVLSNLKEIGGENASNKGGNKSYKSVSLRSHSASTRNAMMVKNKMTNNIEAINEVDETTGLKQ